jgi:hypothetical protein
MYPAGVCESYPFKHCGLAVLPTSQLESVEGRDMIIFSSQIYLRILLNEAHNDLYGAGRFSRLATQKRSANHMSRWQQRF